jgi:hypothetical protein
MKILSILLMFFLLAACNSNNGQKKVVEQEAELVIPKDTTTKEAINQIAETYFQLVYNLRSKDGRDLGSIFIKPLVDNKKVFSSLIILKNSASAKDTLYNINGFNLCNSKGIDIKVYDKDLYGYRFVSKEKDNFILQALHNNGKSVSDNIWIRWNENKSIFEVDKAP